MIFFFPAILLLCYTEALVFDLDEFSNNIHSINTCILLFNNFWIASWYLNAFELNRSSFVAYFINVFYVSISPSGLWFSEHRNICKRKPHQIHPHSYESVLTIGTYVLQRWTLETQLVSLHIDTAYAPVNHIRASFISYLHFPSGFESYSPIIAPINLQNGYLMGRAVHWKVKSCDDTTGS